MYKDCDIPAKLFFKIINTGDYSLVGEGTKEEQEQAFNDIFDEYFKLTNNKSLLTVYVKRHKITLIQAQIHAITSILHAITYVTQTAEERIEQIDLLNSIQGVRVNFSKDKPILLEIDRVQRRVLGALRNQLKMEQSTEKKESQAPELTFERKVVGMSKVTEIRIPPNEISLYEFIEYENLTKEIVAANNKLTKKNGK